MASSVWLLSNLTTIALAMSISLILSPLTLAGKAGVGITAQCSLRTEFSVRGTLPFLDWQLKQAADLNLSHAAVRLELFYFLATAKSSLRNQFPARGNSCLSWSDNYQPDAFV